MENKPTENQPGQTAEDATVENLETPSTVITEDTTGSLDKNDEQPEAPNDDDKKKKKKGPRVKHIAAKVNIYLLAFILVILVAGIVTFLSYQRQREATKQEAETVSTTPLSDEDLEKLRQTDVKVGDPKQILSVESNAVFAGKVLIRDSLEVAGQIKVGGPLNLPGISVSGTSIFDQVQVSNLQISGNATVQGQLNVQSNTSISGDLTVGGTLTSARLNIEVLQTNQDIQLGRHLDAGGGTPGKTDGSALGGGGTASISGTDTAGTVNINTGGGTSAGCFVSVTFTQRFNAPHVVITPVGSAGGALDYYINRSSTGFSICTANTPPVGQSFAFDYIVID